MNNLVKISSGDHSFCLLKNKSDCDDTRHVARRNQKKKKVKQKRSKTKKYSCFYKKGDLIKK
jgi:hypothetical protein